MDEHNVAQTARPGTSLARPATGTAAVSNSPDFQSWQLLVTPVGTFKAVAGCIRR